MKSKILFVIGFLLVASTYGAEVLFANTSTTLLTTNSCAPFYRTGLTSTGYYVGLYVGGFGSRESELILAARTPSQGGAAVGRFAGTNSPPWPFAADQPISFQIRAWPIICGNSFEAAASSFGCENRWLGKSDIGFVVPSSGGPEIPPSLMGNGYGQVPGFTLLWGGPFFYSGPGGITNEFGCPYTPPLTNFVLEIARSMNGHMISWTNAATSYLLEWTATLAVSNQWQAVITNVANSNGLLWYSTTNSEARFYRLRRL